MRNSYAEAAGFPEGVFVRFLCIHPRLAPLCGFWKHPCSDPFSPDRKTHHSLPLAQPSPPPGETTYGLLVHLLASKRSMFLYRRIQPAEEVCGQWILGFTDPKYWCTVAMDTVSQRNNIMQLYRRQSLDPI